MSCKVLLSEHIQQKIKYSWKISRACKVECRYIEIFSRFCSGIKNHYNEEIISDDSYFI
jgi:hypothetical protein